MKRDSIAFPGNLSGGCFAIIPKAKSDKLIVFFSGTGKSDGKFDFWQVGRRYNENVMFINNGRNEWYQRGVPGLGKSVLETVEMIRKWAAALGATQIYMVGASMGGYGAALFGSLLGAKVLAFGIDTLLKTPTSRSSKQMPADIPLVYPDLLPVLRENKTHVHLFVGEMDPMDIVGATRILELPNVKVESVRGVDHKCARFFLDKIGLFETILAFMRGEPLPRVPDVGSICLNQMLVTHVHNAHLALSSSKWAGVVDACKKALELDPSCEIAHYLMGRALIKLKKYQLAVRHFGMVVANVPGFEDGHFYFGHALRLEGDNVRALCMLEKHVDIWPASARAWFNIAKLHETFGDAAAAMSCYEKAAGIDPNDKVYIAKLEEAQTASVAD